MKLSIKTDLQYTRKYSTLITNIVIQIKKNAFNLQEKFLN
jgi:hypothetical protein